VALAGAAIWRGCGISWDREQLTVQPAWPTEWAWWALLDLPIGAGTLSLLWDGSTLHATRPVQSELPLQLVQRITALKTDEHDFDLQFELKQEAEGQVQRRIFKPSFKQ
jgi:hypothetical protein